MFRSPDNRKTPDHDPLKVLVVDDEPTLRLSFSYTLASSTTVVETAANGREALEKIATTRYDIMILDLRMPELDGIGVIAALRAAGNPIPIILCSAALLPDAALFAIRHGVVDFLLKPVRPVDLRQVIEFVLNPEPRPLPLPLALQAARDGRFDEAIQIFKSQATPSRQAMHWLMVLKAIRDADPDTELAHTEQMIRTSLSILAFNAPTLA